MKKQTEKTLSLMADADLEPRRTWRIVTVSGRGLPSEVDAGGYTTRHAAEAMADECHDGEWRVEADNLDNAPAEVE